MTPAPAAAVKNTKNVVGKINMRGRRQQIEWTLEHGAAMATLIHGEMMKAVEADDSKDIDYLADRAKDLENQILLAMKKSKNKITKEKLDAIYNHFLQKVEDMKRAMPLPE